MAHAEKTVLVHRPVQSVFDFILNGANNQLWRSSVTDIKPLSEAPYGVGARFEQGLKGPTGRIPGDYEITEVRPNELIQFRVLAGPARPTGTYRFRRLDGGTELTFVLDYPADRMPKQTAAGSAQQMMQQAKADRSVAAKLSPPEKRAQNFGMVGVAFGLGFRIDA